MKDEIEKRFEELENITIGNAFTNELITSLKNIVIAALPSETAKDQEIERLKNDLADALDCKNGIGPTALSMVVADRDTKNQRIRELEEELRLAIAHDRQPYPTAEAYDLVCKANNKLIETIAAMQRQIDDWREALMRLRKHLPQLSSRPNTITELGCDIEFADELVKKYPKA